MEFAFICVENKIYCLLHIEHKDINDIKYILS